MSRYARVAYTDSVRAVQEEQGSAAAAARRLAEDGGPDPLGEPERAFIASRDGFYLASVSETGWPYVQYRGGPPGFVHTLDEHTLALAEVRGNRQYITTGNVRADGRVALFFMDYARQARLKLFGRAEVREPGADPELAGRLAAVRTGGIVERLLVIRVEGCNWNCSQHITPRFTEQELQPLLEDVRGRLARLEAENAALREQHAALEEQNAALRERIADPA